MYKLYISEHVGEVVYHLFPTVDLTLYSLYENVKAMLKLPTFIKNFIKKKQVLGFCYIHQYAYAYGTANCRLLYTLKGIGVVLYSIFQNSGLKVHVRPVLEEVFS